MQRANRWLWVLSLVVTSLPAIAQVVIATAPTGGAPTAVAVNPLTNKTYVVNFCGNDPNCLSNGTVTVVDGATNNTATVVVGYYPNAVSVNSATNQIYVANACGSDRNCQSGGTVTVIDGTTNQTSSIVVGHLPYALATNSTTNKIYVVNDCGDDVNCNSPGTATVIDASHNNSTTTIPVGDFPEGVAVDAVTNQIYVTNLCGDDISCGSPGTVTVIDGISNNTTTIPAGFSPYYVVLNPATNHIYVGNYCGTDPLCAVAGTVTVIDANNHNSTATVNVQYYPTGLAVNSATNQIYVVNMCGSDPSCSRPGSVTVIDGATNNTSTVNVAYNPNFVDIDSAANKIYVANSCGNDSTCASAGTVTVIDGTSRTTFPIAAGDGPYGVAVNSSTHSVYVPNYPDSTVSVIGGNTKLQLVNVTPCRIVDTRGANGPFGGPAIQGDSVRNFPVPQNQVCNTPMTAVAYSLNVTVVPHGPLGYLTIWPTPDTRPTISTLNSPDGRTKANAAIVPAGVSGNISVYASDTTDVILDIDGYFAPPASGSSQFYSVPPCRVVDTRGDNGPLGGPYLQGNQVRDFPVLDSTCIPSGVDPTAYSYNVTVVPNSANQPLGYLTVWPKGQTQPLTSTLNNPTATVVANAAIVPAGTGGDIEVYASNSTDLIIDINGYFAAPGEGGLSLYPLVPCRVLDTRVPNGNGPFSGTLNPPIDVPGSACGVPSTTLAYVFNATAVPQGGLSYLTLWPVGEQLPTVSTLNAPDGGIASNMAIVETGTQGQVNAYAAGTTDLIMDISSFFAP